MNEEKVIEPVDTIGAVGGVLKVVATTGWEDVSPPLFTAVTTSV